MPKFCVSFKTPDAVEYAVGDALRQEHLAANPDANSDDVDDYMDKEGEERVSAIADQLAKWVRYGETVTIEFDTDADTAVVLPA